MFNSLHAREFCMLFCRLLTFSKLSFSENSFRNILNVSTRLGPVQARRSVGPDLGLNCVQITQQTTLVDKELKL